jgi:hypothetical protein
MSAGEPAALEGIESARIFSIKKLSRTILKVEHQLEGAIGQNVLAVVVCLKVVIVPQPLNMLSQRRTGNVPVNVHGCPRATLREQFPFCARLPVWTQVFLAPCMGLPSTRNLKQGTAKSSLPRGAFLFILMAG